MVIKQQLWAMQDAAIAQHNLSRAMDQSIDFLNIIFESLRLFVASMFGTVQALQSSYNRVLNMARMGDVSALQSLPSAAGQFVSSVSATAGTRSELDIVKATVAQQLIGLEDVLTPEQFIPALDGLRQEMERTTNALGVELAPGIKSLTDAISRLVGLNEEQARIEKERAAEAKRKQKELEQQRKNEARAAVLDKQIRENQQKIKIFESNIKKWTGSFGLSVSSEIVKKVQEEGVHRLSLKEAEKRYGGKGTYLGTAARLARAQTFLDVRREMLARAQRQRAAIPEFATGGTHMGGLRLVGERGPELEATGPSRVMSNDRLMQALGSSDELVKEVRALRVENMAAQRAIERNTREIKQIEQRWDKIGLPEQRVFA
jgi:hypothetical protein